jgi:hypothetical protein
MSSAERVFGALLSFIKSCRDEDRLPSGDTLERAALAWSLVHGIAKLVITGG